jgi:hypothetical protein
VSNAKAITSPLSAGRASRFAEIDRVYPHRIAQNRRCAPTTSSVIAGIRPYGATAPR